MKLFVVLEQLCAIQLFQWDPRQSRLAICTANTRVYLWSPAGCVSVQVPMEGKAPNFCHQVCVAVDTANVAGFFSGDVQPDCFKMFPE